MRFAFAYALLVATAVAVPHGGSKKGIDQPAATPSMSMSMPMKRATPTAQAIPSASASLKAEKRMKAEHFMTPF